MVQQFTTYTQSHHKYHTVGKANKRDQDKVLPKQCQTANFSNGTAEIFKQIILQCKMYQEKNAL